MSSISVCVTDRDEEIVRFLLSQGHATAKQLAERYFPSMHAFYARISTLKRMGLVETANAYTEARAARGGVLDFMKCMNVRRKQVDKMKIYRPSLAIRRLWPRADGGHNTNQMLKHQLLLNDIRARIEKHLTGISYIVLNDTEYKSETVTKMYPNPLIPDLVFRGGDLKLAVELERTEKSESDLAWKMAQYRDSLFSHMIYYSGNETIHRRLFRLVRAYPCVALAAVWDPERVWCDREFMTLAQFLERKHVHNRRRLF